MKQDYFALEGISNSQLSHFKRSPAHYKHYVDKGMESTDAMVKGSSFHYLTLEPDNADKYLMVFDESKRPSKNQTFQANVNKQWKAEFYQEAKEKGLDVISIIEYDKSRYMGDAVRKDTQAREILEYSRSKYEVSRQWVWNGIKFKGKIDIESDIFLADLKSTRDASPEAFRKVIIYDELYRQGGMYTDGDAIGTESFNRKDFFFIAVENEPPFAVSVHVMHVELIQKGIDEYRRLGMDLHECITKDEFPGYSYNISRSSRVYSRYGYSYDETKENNGIQTVYLPENF